MIPADPLARFRETYALAEKIDRSLVPDPSAMSLATVEEGAGLVIAAGDRIELRPAP